MKRIDYYILGVFVFNVFLFVKFTNTALTSPISSILEYGSTAGYAIFILFVVSIGIILNNLSQLITFTASEGWSTMTVKELAPVYTQTLILLATYSFLRLFDAYLVYDMYGTF